MAGRVRPAGFFAPVLWRPFWWWRIWRALALLRRRCGQLERRAVVSVFLLFQFSFLPRSSLFPKIPAFGAGIFFSKRLPNFFLFRLSWFFS